VIAVSDASPLIALARIGRLNLLKSLFGRVLIPDAVYQEVVVSGTGLPGANEVRDAEWIETYSGPDAVSYLAAESARLGEGEAATIRLAKQLSADIAILDDAKARRVALAAGLTITGSIGILELGFRRGLVKDLRTAYVDLLRQGIRFDLGLLRESLAKFGQPGL
jgi:predicted nucleic acid-binding protein